MSGTVADLEGRVAFVRAHARPAPVPLAPELSLYQAAALTPVWRATRGPAAGCDPAPPYWAFPWAGGQALARYLLDDPGTVRGRTVFDFGSGSGLVAIAAARAGAARVVAADLDPLCEAAVRLNAELNGVQLEYRAGDALGERLPGFDLVLAGDMFYERRLAEEGLAWLASLAGLGARVLVGDPGRIYSPCTGVRELARYDVGTSLEIERQDRLPARVLQVRAAR